MTAPANTAAPMIQPSAWTEADSASASAEGWGVFHVDGCYYDIQKCDEADVFPEDPAAVWHVFTLATSGSQLHRRALLFVLREDNVCPPPIRARYVAKTNPPTGATP